jgi:hypothetical protein
MFIRDDIDWGGLRNQYLAAKPFHHCVIDDFFLPDVAAQLSKDFPDYDAPVWRSYNNAIENKHLINHWDQFPAATYSVMRWLSTPAFLDRLGELTNIADLNPDPGLSGGGWHAHSNQGKLNVHLDYSLHPKLQMERRLNLIVYLTPGWRPEWGGALELWSNDPEKQQPKERIQALDCLFNRAVLFDTTQNSWHGLPEQLRCPDGVIRRSLAAYYLTPPRPGASERGKALFAPHGKQADDPAVLELIRQRSNVATAASVYEEKKK